MDILLGLEQLEHIDKRLLGEGLIRARQAWEDDGSPNEDVCAMSSYIDDELFTMLVNIMRLFEAKTNHPPYLLEERISRAQLILIVRGSCFKSYKSFDDDDSKHNSSLSYIYQSLYYNALRVSEIDGKQDRVVARISEVLENCDWAEQYQTYSMRLGGIDL